MSAALSLARRNLGQTWPNPSVGCVIVADGRVVGRAVTAVGGRPHAEVLALAMAGAATHGATAYVTLEPCAHHGATPPCADALVAAGVARVAVAMRDPDARTNGQGIARLRAAGIAVDEGVCADAAADVNAGFVSARVRARPMVTLKMAATLDGRIATRSGESQWITGPEARRASQGFRATHDAILVGVNTVLADNPLLTCRLPGARGKPLVRVVADSSLRMPASARLAATVADAPFWLLARPDADAQRKLAFVALGAEVIDVAPAEAGIDFAAALRALAARGITRVLAEGGAQVAASLLRADLVDRIAWFAAPALMGADGFAAAARFGVERLDAMPRFVIERVSRVGADVLTEMRRVEF